MGKQKSMRASFEDDFDVEDDEGHGDEIELRREAFDRLGLGHDAALIGRTLRGVCPLRSEQCGREERTGDEQHDEHDHRQDRQVGVQMRLTPPYSGTWAQLASRYPKPRCEPGVAWAYGSGAIATARSTSA